MKMTTQNSVTSRTACVLSEDRRFWMLAAVVLGTVSILKGIRLPSLWAATQALLNYDHGLVRRGFFGAVTRGWLHGERYANFVAFSFAMLLALICLIGWLIVRSGMSRTIGNGETAAIFCASFAMTYLAHLIGYMDLVLAAIAIGLLLIRNPIWRFIAAVPLCVVAILIHELFFVVFLPVVLLSWIVDAVRRPVERRRDLAMAAALLVICTVVTATLAFQKPLPATEVASIQTVLQHRANFPLRDDFFPVLSRSTAESVQTIRDEFRVGLHIQWFAICLLELLPTFALLLYAVRLAVKQLATGRMRTWLTAFAIVAAAAPFAMHLQGVDVGRFNAWVVVDCFLVLAVVCPREGEVRIELPSWYRNATVMTIALSMASGEGLMDYRGVNQYPFTGGAVELFGNAVRHHLERPAY